MRRKQERISTFRKYWNYWYCCWRKRPGARRQFCGVCRQSSAWRCDQRKNQTKKERLRARGNWFDHKKSDKRIEPFCQHFGSCGGCKWQHVDYKFQLQFKQRQIVEDAFRRIGKINLENCLPILGCERNYILQKQIRIYIFGQSLADAWTNWQRWIIW